MQDSVQLRFCRPAGLAGVTSVLLLVEVAASATADTVPVPTHTSNVCQPGQVYTGQALTPCEATVTAADGSFAKSVTVLYSWNVNAGTAFASAGYFDPNDVYAGSSGMLTFDSAQAPAIANISCPRTVAYTGEAVEPCTGSVTLLGKTQALSVTYRDNVGPGQATASVSFHDDKNFTGTAVGITFSIGAPTTVTVSCTPGSTYTGSPLTPCTAKATASDGFTTTVPVTFSDNTNAGTATATATSSGDGEGGHLGSSASTTFTIAKAPSSVTVTCPLSVTYTGEYLTPCTATASGAGTLTSVPYIKYSANRDAGPAEANGVYSPDADHLASNSPTFFTIDKAPVVVTVSCPASVDYTGAPLTPCTATATGPGGLATTVPVTYSDNTYAGTATATATFPGDGNHLSGTGTATFRVIGFILKGYYSPVTMSTPDAIIWNRVTAGSTVLLKFEAFLPGGTEITSTTTLGATFTVTPLACVATSSAEEVAPAATGGTTLRYDASAGQFFQTWKTPKASGCYRVTTTTADHSQLSAYFLLR